MEVLYNYSRRINLTFLNEETGAEFKIECPAKGRKPNIQISGTLLPVDYMSDVEIRVVNLYIERGQTFQKVRVEAGYENSMSIAFEGEITNIYDESPGPEKVTVINCTQGKIKNMLSNVIALNLEKGFTLNSALSQIAKAAELDAPVITFTDTETGGSPFTFNGTVQEALHQLSPLFPSVTLMFTDRTIKAVKNEISPAEKAKPIKFLQSPPQVTGTVVIITPLRTGATTTHSGTVAVVTHSGTTCAILLYLTAFNTSLLQAAAAIIPMCRTPKYSMAHAVPALIICSPSHL